jgi:hypothetical protein
MELEERVWPTGMAPLFILAATGARVPSWPPDPCLMVVAAGHLVRLISIVRVA